MDNNELLELFEDPDIVFEMMDEKYNNDCIEESTVVVGPKDKMSLHTTIDPNYNLGEDEGYFKWVNHKSFSKADQIARIKFGKAEYVDHNGRDGKETHRLSSGERKDLVETLNKPIDKKALKDIDNQEIRDYLDGKTNWALLVYKYNNQNHISDEDILKYSFGPYDKDEYPRNLIPLDIKQPDYRKLKE